MLGRRLRNSMLFPDCAALHPGYGRPRSSRRNPHVFEVAGLVVDADLGGRDPFSELSRLPHRLHQCGDEIAVGFRRQPLILPMRPGSGVYEFAVWRCMSVAKLADLAMECHMGKPELKGDAGFLDGLVPTPDALPTIGRIIVAQAHVQCSQCRLVHGFYFTADELEHRIGRALKSMIVADPGLVEAPLETGIETIRRVGGDFGAEQVEG